MKKKILKDYTKLIEILICMYQNENKSFLYYIYGYILFYIILSALTCICLFIIGSGVAFDLISNQ